MNFLNIYTVYDEETQRNIHLLSSLYHNHKFLFLTLEKILNGHLSINIKAKRILLKPNWVYHYKRKTDWACLVTNENFILALLEVIVRYKPCSIVIGDAPIQSCIWEKLVSNEFLNRVKNLSEKHNIPIQIKDLRRTIFIPGRKILHNELNPLEEYVIFNLGYNSFLEPITYNKTKFRVTNYDSKKLEDSHKQGIHKYCISREIFDSDIVISLPKIKTHQKTGVTGALKNLVGINGDKDFLPHHRMGGTKRGGDCYPGGNILRYLSEQIVNKANKHRGKFEYLQLIRLASLFWRLSLPRKVHRLDAGWWGNDTTWRMVLDLNLIVYYGKTDGTVSDQPQRKVFSLCDGIIAGQGEGPLSPEPLPLGIISFTDNPAANDIAMVTLMGFDYKKFPLLTESYKLFNFYDVNLKLNDKFIKLNDLNKYSIPTMPPGGWKDYLLQ